MKDQCATNRAPGVPLLYITPSLLPLLITPSPKDATRVEGRKGWCAAALPPLSSSRLSPEDRFINTTLLPSSPFIFFFTFL